MQKINCAIYVRKSTEHGLDMEFNSLQNQEESCKAYILSQAYNGWEYYKTYADGGISGGTMERPSLLEMLGEIKQGNIQVVVVYKVDRLSRSIVDFHKMMQEFNKYNCSFVSITQAFDTSTSMGKLTLNMLLSFAQFEREVSAERVRDKIAASKAKGIWLGGTPMLGYDIQDKQLIPNEDEAQTVNYIYNKYLEIGTILDTCNQLNREGYKSKEWKTKKGKTKGGGAFDKSKLHRILTNPIYIGKIPHYSCNKTYDGKHKAIITEELFNKVQEHLSRRISSKTAYDTYLRDNSLLAGLLVDEKGNNYRMTSCKKKTRKIRYYYNSKGGRFLPLEQLNNFVLNSIRGADYRDYERYGDISEITVKEAKICLSKVICERIDRDCHLTIILKKKAVLDYLSHHRKEEIPDTISISIKPEIDNETDALVIKQLFMIDNCSAKRLRNSNANNVVTIREINESLVRGLARGWQIKKMMEKGLSTREISKLVGLDNRTKERYYNLCYLSPNIIRDILEYKNPSNMTLRNLIDLASKETDFEGQEHNWKKTIKLDEWN